MGVSISAISHVTVTTSLAAAAGVAMAGLFSTWALKKPDLSMVLNGALAGLVGVTAGADVLSPAESIMAGGVAGVIVVLGVLAIDRMRIDDPVGAVAVHLLCGIWGTLAVGIWHDGASLATQAIGVLAVGALCVPFSFVVFFVLEKTLGIRVEEREERIGLDIEEHGMESYAGFQIYPT